MTDADELGLPGRSFGKQDDGGDLDFYAPTRLVTHIDDNAVVALSALYRQLLPPGAAVLDLMSSWVSHLPAELALGDVVGHGMNADELRANPRLDRFFVQDLNRDPLLPECDSSFDAVLVCVGVQYLQRPLAVFREIRRVLRPGGIVVTSFSNRCFPTKAVAIWRALDLAGQAHLVRLYGDKAWGSPMATPACSPTVSPAIPSSPSSRGTAPRGRPAAPRDRGFSSCSSREERLRHLVPGDAAFDRRHRVLPAGCGRSRSRRCRTSRRATPSCHRCEPGARRFVERTTQRQRPVPEQFLSRCP